MAIRRIGLIHGARTDKRNIKARLNRGRMPIWNYTRRVGITGSRRLGLRLHFCLTCLTRDKNVIQGTGHRDMEGGTRTRRNVANARSLLRISRRRLDAQRENDNVREKSSLLIHCAQSICFLPKFCHALRRIEAPFRIDSTFSSFQFKSSFLFKSTDFPNFAKR